MQHADIVDCKPQPALAASAGALAVVAAGAGAWWTALAVIEGRPEMMMIRLGLSILTVLYYVTLRVIGQGGGFRRW